MKEDIFDFWSQLADKTIHPADENVFKRLKKTNFKTECLPAPFFGPLRTAPITLLFLSPGHRNFDTVHAQKSEGRKHYKNQRSGLASLPSKNDNEDHYKWWIKIVRQFLTDEEKDAQYIYANYKDKFAFLNIAAYHSKEFKDWHTLTALPSSRFNLNWAQSELFKQAETGNRVVVCLRSHAYWGLTPGEHYLKNLFSPECTRGGFMCNKKHMQSKMRDKVTEAVREALRKDVNKKKVA